jgi:ferredoxin
MEVDVLGELNAHGEVRSTKCVICLKCTDECPEEAIAFTMRRTRGTMSAQAVIRAERNASGRRKLSAFDVSIALLWVAVVLAFSLAGLRQNSPQAIKVVMTPGLLLAFYGLALVARKVWDARTRAGRRQ